MLKYLPSVLSICFLNPILIDCPVQWPWLQSRKQCFLTVLPKLQEQKWTSTPPSLHSFTHTHTDTEAGIQFFPLGPLLLSPGISQRGFHVGSRNTLTAAFPHSSAMFFLLGSHPIAYGQLSPGPCPLSCLTKTHRKIILSVVSVRDQSGWRSMPFTPLLPTPPLALP